MVCLAAGVCVFCLLLGLGFTTPSGNYWFTMFNDYGATFSLLLIVLIEVITVSYIYGIRRWVVFEETPSCTGTLPVPLMAVGVPSIC